MRIKEEYHKFELKYKLPSFGKIDNEFEISAIEEIRFLLREVRRKIVEKIEIYCKILESILQPETSVCDMYECSVITEEDKERLFNLYRKLMFFNRFSIETFVDETDEKSSEFINLVWKDWPEINKEFSFFVKKIKDSWLEDIDVKTQLGYLG